MSPALVAHLVNRVKVLSGGNRLPWCDSVTELFDQLLDRLEQDYNTDYGTNLTQQVGCGEPT